MLYRVVAAFALIGFLLGLSGCGGGAKVQPPTASYSAPGGQPGNKGIAE